MDLSKKKCVPCEGEVKPFNKKEISEYKKLIKDDWKVTSGNDKILKEFLFVNFKQTMDFVNKVADIAEKEGHHPDLHVYYGRVVIELWTHAINGLSVNDFILAAKIDKL